MLVTESVSGLEFAISEALYYCKVIAIANVQKLRQEQLEQVFKSVYMVLLAMGSDSHSTLLLLYGTTDFETLQSFRFPLGGDIRHTQYCLL